jgi:uncharacterized protein (DUF1697 family)
VTRFVGLLRGINVGKNRVVRMADLRDVCEAAGCESVATYVQSGNVVFAHGSRSPATIEGDLERRITALAGFDVPVMLRTAREWGTIVEKCPFPGVEPTRLHVAFLKQKGDAAGVRAVDVARFAPETLTVAGREVYLHLPNGVGRSALVPALAKARVPMTLRNWRTVTKLQALVSSAEREL